MEKDNLRGLKEKVDWSIKWQSGKRANGERRWNKKVLKSRVRTKN